MSDRILPERTAPTEYTVDPETGETTLIVEHFRQGENRYRIVHNLASIVAEEDANQKPPRRWTKLAIETALAQADMLDAMDAFLEQTTLVGKLTAARAFSRCDYIEEGYPTAEAWSALLDGAAVALGKSREEVNAFLDALPTETER